MVSIIHAVFRQVGEIAFVRLVYLLLCRLRIGDVVRDPRLPCFLDLLLRRGELLAGALVGFDDRHAAVQAEIVKRFKVVQEGISVNSEQCDAADEE
jgi:hypothetical protein